MPTLLELIDALRDNSGDHPTLDQLNAAIADTSTTSVTLSSGANVAAGSTFEVGLEEFLVRAKPSVTVATVIRGWHSSLKSSHSNGADVRISYRFPAHQYRRAINRVLDAISIAFGKVAWNEDKKFGADHIIEVPSDALRVFDVRERTTDDFLFIPFIFHRTMPSFIASGKAVELIARNPGSGTVYIGYEKPWPNLVQLTDNLDTTFPAEAMGLLELGVEAYLTSAQTFERMAFSSPHRILETTANPDQLRLQSLTKTQQFILLRSEVATRYRRDSLAWLRG